MGTDNGSCHDCDRLRRVADFYRSVLELGVQQEIQPLLEQALSLIVGIAGARRGYIEIGEDGDGGEAPGLSVAYGCTDDDVQDIRASFSTGIIAEAIATRETVVTVSALDDPRFKKRRSVRRNRIEAVLCAPVGVENPLGVIYLQDRVEPGPFSEGDRDMAEVFARHLATLTDRLLILRKQRNEADATAPVRKKLRAEGIVGRSAALARVLEHVLLAAPLNVGVLLTGPSGTGKTQLARVIHNNGPRAAGPFVEINCANVAETLLESELFGALPGAHSTATRKMDGKLAAAEGGTLFLDEVALLHSSAQAKLLQFLHSKEYYPLGGTKAVRADVRIVAATNVDLSDAVARREFRDDLYYRLQVLPVLVPSLAERLEDIGDLCSHFVARACVTHQFPQLSMSPGALRAARLVEWPGNIRQLANCIEAAVIRANGEGVLVIEPKHLFPERRGADNTGVSAQVTYQEAMRRCQCEVLRRALKETEGNVSEAALRLDITRSHVYNLIKTCGLSRQDG